MQRLYWESFSFATGVHTHHAWTEGGEIFARDIRNLRADENAYLRLRPPVGSLAGAAPTDAVTGVYATQTHLFFLEEKGVLSAVSLDNEAESRVSGISGLSGRLWMVDAFRDFYIGKTEGQEKGFWIDTTEGTLMLRNLGLDPPPLPGFLAVDDDENPLDSPGDVAYVFWFTSARVFGDRILDQLTRDTDPNPLFAGMESNPSAPFVVIFRQGGGDLSGLNITQFVREDGSDVHVAYVDTDTYNSLQFVNLQHSMDPQVTGMFIYQSHPQEILLTSIDPPAINVDRLEGRQIQYVLRGISSSLDLNERSDDTFSDQVSMRRDNDRLPAEPAQITYYNDLIFAAVGDELRYSDVRDGAPVQWAWPEANSIRASGAIVFCVEWRGVLLFGGPSGIWRLTGVDEFSFDRDQISAIGPVARGAWGRFENGIGFVSQAGLYITNGVTVEKVSSPFLDGYFEDEAVGGSVVLLPSHDEVWSVDFLSPVASKQFLRSTRGGWFVWSDVAAVQFAVSSDVVFADGITQDVRTVEYSDFEKIRDAPLLAETSWQWLSQEIDFKEQGYGEALKVFKWLEVSSSHSGDGHLHIFLEGVGQEAISFSFRADTQRPVRIPINRRGERIQFSIFGSGEVIIRSLRLVADVRSARSRY